MERRPFHPSIIIILPLLTPAFALFYHRFPDCTKDDGEVMILTSLCVRSFILSFVNIERDIKTPLNAVLILSFAAKYLIFLN